jgi:F-type H+-transporting ATPase subunit delta
VKAGTESAANHYAEAILAIASKTKDLPERIASDLKAINEVITVTRDLKLVLDHPSIGDAQKKAFLSSLFASKVDDLSLRVLELLADKRRLRLLPQIESQYKRLLNDRKQIVTARLIGSDQLAERDLANLKARLTEHLGKSLELEVSVDQSLIGGFILRLGDQVIDGSLKGKLRSIEKSLMTV